MLLATAAVGSWQRCGGLVAACHRDEPLSQGSRDASSARMHQRSGSQVRSRPRGIASGAALGQRPQHVGSACAPAGVNPLMAGAICAPSLPARTE